ncbi:probably inactive leucine-rich repeat receptor-like protein kinase At5g48380 [Triticum dicoccoides]|uniref:probably inactive leucine-rich repeat receptor-like protein kinase At5g48380 n=1 Tax=Triticum dicoccoides TaxID=85692 RepID=UPI000E797938|nr:probably inactive leucine-rich repeat receptor-like protein kinase At5g48380 [Triticum dicoccoides]
MIVRCLKSVQQSVIDPSGVLKSSWNFENTTKGYICRFTGVDCWYPGENRVLSLRIGNLGLEGPFPQGLQNCSSVTDLDLSNNNFSGPIPQDISRQMPYLTSLDLSYNSFSGSIPQNISNMTYLNVLNLQHNQLSGQIPPQFTLLTRLTAINVADNLLSGPIPSSP